MKRFIVIVFCLISFLVFNACSYFNTITTTSTEEQTSTTESDLVVNRDQVADFEDLFDYSVRHTFIVDFTQEEFDGLIADMESYHLEYGTYRSNNMRKVDVTYISDDNSFIIKDVGYRSKGNLFSRVLPIDSNGDVRDIHFVLKFNETFDYSESSDTYQILKKREVFNLEKLIFKHNRQDDETYVNEVFCYETFRQVGVPAPYATIAEVQIRIDGELKKSTLYTVIEHYDEEFIRKHLQDEPRKVVGDLYKVRWGGDLSPIDDSNLYGVREWETNTRPVYGKETNKDIDSYQTLIDFTFMIHQGDLIQRKQYLEDNLDVDTFIRYLSIRVLLGSPDDYRGSTNNYYLYFDENSYVTFIPYDYDYSMGEGWNGVDLFYGLDVQSTHNPYTLGNDIYNWGRQDFGSYEALLVDIILAYEDYRFLYEEYMLEFIDTGIYSTNSYHLIADLTLELYGEKFDISYDKDFFINSKISDTLSQIEFYRNSGNSY